MVPKAVSTSGMMAAAAMGTANTASWAKYLPITIEGIPTGLVSSSWSVLLRRSSAKLRMVSAGSKNNMTSVVEYKTVEKSDVPYTRQLAE